LPFIHSEGTTKSLLLLELILLGMVFLLTKIKSERYLRTPSLLYDEKQTFLPDFFDVKVTVFHSDFPPSVSSSIVKGGVKAAFNIVSSVTKFQFHQWDVFVFSSRSITVPLT
jgi:hypothetical protein